MEHSSSLRILRELYISYISCSARPAFSQDGTASTWCQHRHKPLHVVPKGGGGKGTANLGDDLNCGTSRFGASVVLAVPQDAGSVAQGPMEITEREQKIPSAWGNWDGGDPRYLQ